MNSVRTYHVIAFVTGGFGALLAIGVIAAAFLGALSAEEKKDMLLAYALLALAAIIAVGLVHSAIAHLKKPGRRSALTLAVNTAVLIWGFSSGLLGAVGAKEAIGPAYSVIGIGIAYLCYRFSLRPAALHAFPANEDGR